MYIYFQCAFSGDMNNGPRYEICERDARAALAVVYANLLLIDNKAIYVNLCLLVFR